MSKTQKKLLLGLGIIIMSMGIVPVAQGMHIMEGYLSVGYCVVWGLIAAPFLIGGYLSLKKKLELDRRSITLMALAGAFIFVISSLKIPSVTGSCSHMTGTGLSAILIGPFATSILSVIVLLFQAILIAHGGLSTLGANVFSMGIAGPFLAYGIYRGLTGMKVDRKIAIFFGAMLGDLFTYSVTSFQLALAHPSEVGGVMASLVKFLAVFAPTQIPLSIVEGLLTVVIFIGIETYAKTELRAVGFLKEAN